MKQWILASWLTIALAPVPVSAGEDAADVVALDVMGESSVDDADPKVRALDDAFAQAVRRVTEGLLPGRLSVEQRRAVQEHVYRRARRFVRSYSLRDSAQADGRLRLGVTARVSTAQIREVLQSQGIAASADEAPSPAPAPVRARPKVAVLVASSGSSGTDGAADMAQRGVEELGFEVAHSRDLPPPTSGELVAADEAIRLAGKGVGGAFVVALSAKDDGGIRATGLRGAVATARLRVVDGGGGEVGEATASAASYAGDAALAERKASAEALRLALAKMRRPLAAYWPAPAPRQGGIDIVITGIHSERSLSAIERHLAASRAKIDIVARRLRRGMFQWNVDSSLSATRLAALLGSVPMPSGSISARSTGPTRIEVRVQDFSGGS